MGESTEESMGESTGESMEELKGPFISNAVILVDQQNTGSEGVTHWLIIYLYIGYVHAKFNPKA